MYLSKDLIVWETLPSLMVAAIHPQDAGQESKYYGGKCNVFVSAVTGECRSRITQYIKRNKLEMKGRPPSCSH